MVRIFLQLKTLCKPPGAVLVIVHGLAEHAGRYDYVTRKLNENEISVTGFDLRGHGRSGGLRGNNDDPDKFLKDTDLVARLALKENQGKPVFMLGHSLGGLIAAGYGAGHGDVLKGMIPSGRPWISSRPLVTLQKPIPKLWETK